MRRIKLFAICASLMVCALALVGCDEEYNEEDGYGYEEGYSDSEFANEYANQSDEYDYGETVYAGHISYDASEYPLGSCGELEGNTVLVSIFIDDVNSSWSSNPSAIEDALAYTGIATEWVSKQAAAYGCNSNFVYDWKANPDLYYEGSVGISMTDEEVIDGSSWEFINDNMDPQALIQKYNADNIGFMFYVNTPMSNTLTSCARNYYEGMEYPYEMCFVYMYCENEEECPASIAHEILHMFGAPDLYLADTTGDNYGIPQEFVDELTRTQTNDIMFTTYDAKTDVAHYDRITNEFSEIDAYYVGLTDSCETVNEWNMQPSQHR